MWVIKVKGKDLFYNEGEYIAQDVSKIPTLFKERYQLDELMEIWKQAIEKYNDNRVLAHAEEVDVYYTVEDLEIREVDHIVFK